MPAQPPREARASAARSGAENRSVLMWAYPPESWRTCRVRAAPFGAPLRPVGCDGFHNGLGRGRPKPGSLCDRTRSARITFAAAPVKSGAALRAITGAVLAAAGRLRAMARITDVSHQTIFVHPEHCVNQIA